MSDGDVLLRAVLIDPADDVARLAYADWLEEQGLDLRAEFIRVQVAEARLGKECPFLAAPPGEPLGHVPVRCGLCEWCRLRIRAQAVHDTPGVLGLERYPHPSRVEPMWTDGCPAPGPAPVFVWRRGFVAEIHGPLWLPFRHYGPSMIQALRRVCPLHPVREVRLNARRPQALGRYVCWARGGALRQPRRRGRVGLAEPRAPEWKTLGVTAVLPSAIWDALPDSGLRSRGKGLKAYASEEAALYALTDACVAFGRKPPICAYARRVE